MITDKINSSYNTVANGYVTSYMGAIADSDTLYIGVRSTGTPHYVAQNGYVKQYALEAIAALDIDTTGLQSIGGMSVLEMKILALLGTPERYAKIVRDKGAFDPSANFGAGYNYLNYIRSHLAVVRKMLSGEEPMHHLLAEQLAKALD